MGIFDLESREALIGTPTVSVSENPTGNVLERLAYITNRIATGGSMSIRQVALSLGIPPPSSEPVDRTISESMTFENNVVHYYRNLTIAPGVTVTLRNGPMIIVVEEDLTVGEGAVVSGDGLGGKRGVAAKGGYGGNFWNYNVAAESQASSDPLLVMQNYGLGLAVPEGSGWVPIVYPFEAVVAWALFGLENNGVNGPGTAQGRAWQNPLMTNSFESDVVLLRALVICIFSRPTYSSQYGGLGGGGGGGGATTSGDSISVPGAKYYAGKGHDGNAAGEPGTGGLGFGGGGSGGTKNSGLSGSGGYGGDGGGTQLWIVKRINNAGTIRSNGNPGGSANNSGGGGGGGGGGCAALLYAESFGAGVGTWQANGGFGGSNGTGGQYTYSGGQGGAGMVKTVQLVL